MTSALSGCKRNEGAIRVCVLACSYEQSDSALRKYEGHLVQTPQHYFKQPEDATEFVFHLELIKKATAYREVRRLVMSHQYDVFYNQCDGAKDEDRAGLEVVQALEEFHVPFTGSLSKYYELSKPDMKFVAHQYKINTAPFAVVERGDDVEAACAHMRFPMIIKHVSGYSSVGMDKSCKVANTDELRSRVARFIDEFQFALIEEFVKGDEATILVCNDASEPDGVRVFHPVCINFPSGEDFKHFQLKWSSYKGMTWRRVDEDDPALPAMIDVARKSFKRMMGGVGYGRVDVRIDRSHDNEVVFLEINPNCGIMYPPGEEGSADWVLCLSTGMRHREFARLQIDEAIRRAEQTRPLYLRCYNATSGYHLRAATHIAAGTVVFRNEGEAVQMCTKPYVQGNYDPDDYEVFIRNAWPIGDSHHYYALWNHDPAHWRLFSHSCDPTLAFGENASLNLCALRDIEKGEELTMDYRTFMDDTTPPFECHCGKANCAKWVAPGRSVHATQAAGPVTTKSAVLGTASKEEEWSTNKTVLHDATPSPHS